MSNVDTLKLPKGREIPDTRYKMNYWIISDTHFGHNKLVKSGYRPENCYVRMLKSLHTIGPNDVLIHLGDMSFYRCDYWHRLFMYHCPAIKKYLIKGNHDRRSNAWYLEHGWDWVGDEMTLNMFGKEIIFSHRPKHITPPFGNKVNVHGHLHGDRHHGVYQLHDGVHFLVAMEHDYTCYSLRKFIGA